MNTPIMPAPGTRSRKRAGTLSAGIALAALAALAAGCSTSNSPEFDVRDHDFRARHPILISEEPEVLDMPVGMNGPAISPEIEDRIRHYVAEYRADGTGAITLQVPTGSANEVAAASTGRAVHYALVRAGVPRRGIKVAPYPVDDTSKIAPLRLSYLRVKAVVPRCGVWPDTSQANFRNTDHPNFGCAQTHNLAAMIDNPADFISPRPMDPAFGARRAKVIGDYSSGAETKSNTVLINSSVGG